MMEWKKIAPVSEFMPDCGACALVDGVQIAIFNFGLSQWYAVQNECPHELRMCLSRGLIGDAGGKPKVSCPMHKNAFSLEDGVHLGGNPKWQLKVWPVKSENGDVYIFHTSNA